MTPAAKHPAAALPEAERSEYFRSVASLAFADGRATSQELGKLHRLAEVIDVPPATVERLLEVLRGGEAATNTALLARLRGDEILRKSLMTDSVVIVFADGALAQRESRRLTALAAELGFSNDEVIAISRFVEQVLFKREGAEQQSLSRDMGEALAQGGYKGIGGWILHVFGG